VGPLVALLLALSEGLAAQSDPVSTNDFVLRPGDVLSILVWPDATLSGDFPVEESGIVYVPILGAVTVGGMSLGQVREVLRDGYTLAMRAPIVTITPLFRVSVLGAARQPGLFQVDPTMSLYQVISLAGGFAENADESGIQVVRSGDVIAIDRPGDPESSSADFDLRSGDRIIIPRKSSLLSLQGANLFLQSAVFIATILTLTRR
jgi:protein involved in polysaccharide export with SLBB domain